MKKQNKEDRQEKCIKITKSIWQWLNKLKVDNEYKSISDVLNNLKLKSEVKENEN